MTSQGMYNAATLCKRLEAVTARLEDIVATLDRTAGAGDAWKSTAKEHLVDALRVVHDDNTSANPTENDEAGKPIPSDLQDFDIFLDSTVKRYVDLSKDIGGPVAKQAQCVLLGLQEERKIIEKMSQMSKPNSAALDSLFGPVAQAMAVAKAIQDANRGHALYNHLSCVADGIMLLAWMKVQMRPFRHIDQMLECAQYFGNKVKMDHKQKNSKDGEWVEAFFSIFRDLSELVKQNYSSGINSQVGRNKSDG